METKTQIDIVRLRRLLADADAFHGALIAADDELRDAKKDFARAEKARESVLQDHSSRRISGGSHHEVLDRERQAAAAAERARQVADAVCEQSRQRVEVARINRDEAHRRWSDANRLAHSCREYARAQNVLPQDLARGTAPTVIGD